MPPRPAGCTRRYSGNIGSGGVSLEMLWAPLKGEMGKIRELKNKTNKWKQEHGKFYGEMRKPFILKIGLTTIENLIKIIRTTKNDQRSLSPEFPEDKTKLGAAVCGEAHLDYNFPRKASEALCRRHDRRHWTRS